MDARPIPPDHRRGAAARILVPALLLAAAIVVHLLVAQDGRRRERAELSSRATATAQALERRVTAYGDVLYGMRGLFAASDRVTRREFQASLTAQSLWERHPGVAAVGFAALETPRAPVRFIKTATGRSSVVGYDLRQEPRRRAAFDAAVAGGQLTATAPLELVSGPRDQLGFVAMLGVRDRSGRPAGAVFATFRLRDLVVAVEGPVEDADVQLLDLGSSADPRPLADATPMSDTGADTGDARHGSRVVPFDVMGRRWAVLYAPAHSLAPAGVRLLSWLPLLAGGLLALLAIWLLRGARRTERRAVALAERMTESLRASETELARSNAELERFAYVASHDLREPLRTVTGFLGLLTRRHGDRLGEEASEFVGLAVEGAKRMDALIAELLEFSRAGRHASASEPTDLDAAWRVAVRNLSAAAAAADADVTAGPLPIVMAERGEMVQVLQNLLSNALKYRAADGCRVHAAAVRRGDEWHVSVTDDGPGVDPRHHERIFISFQRLHRHDEIEGTGMGLAICKKIVERHGGRIWVESTPGAGARFVFTLPAATAAPSREPAVSGAA